MDVKELATRILELTDRHDWAGREALMTPDCDFLMPMAALKGPAAATAFSTGFMAAFTEDRHLVDLLVADGDVAVVEGRWLGTNSGPLVTPAGEAPATGKAVTLPFVMVVQAAGDRAASVRISFDQLGFMAQLGLLPELQAA